MTTSASQLLDAIHPAPPAMHYASFWQRFCAQVIDLFVMLPVAFILVWIVGQGRIANVVASVASMLIVAWFNVYLVKRYGGTPGKLMMHIRIAKTDGSAIGYREAALRYSVLCVILLFETIAMGMAVMAMDDADYISHGYFDRNTKLQALLPAWYMLVYYLGQAWTWSEILVILTNKRRRSLHDYMAGTIVLNETQG
jgi:uncharacterized RDD family membrane protein YckC